MAGYIEYNKILVKELRVIASKLTVSSTGTKPILVKRLKTYEDTLNGRFRELQEKYVPPQGKADTRQGKILRLVSRLIYRYYNDGDAFNETIEEYPEPYNDLHREDKRWFDAGAPGVEGENVKENSIKILNFMEDTIRRVEELERETEAQKPSPRKEERRPSPRREDFYTIIIERLDPRGIEEVLLTTLERIPSLLLPRVSEEGLRKFPAGREFSFLDVKDSIPRKITLKRVVLNE